MREEFAEHEGVVGLGVVLGKTDVFVHVEGHDVFESEWERQLPRTGERERERLTRAFHP